MCGQYFDKTALNTFTMQDKMHAIILDNFKIKPRDSKVVESSYRYSIYFQQTGFFFPEGIINSKPRNGFGVLWNKGEIKMTYKNPGYRLRQRELNHVTYALMSGFSRSP